MGRLYEKKFLNGFYFLLNCIGNKRKYLVGNETTNISFGQTGNTNCTEHCTSILLYVKINSIGDYIL